MFSGPGDVTIEFLTSKSFLNQSSNLEKTSWVSRLSPNTVQIQKNTPSANNYFLNRNPQNIFLTAFKHYTGEIDREKEDAEG